MHEQSLVIGPGGRIVATITYPQAGRALSGAPVALLTNAGVIPRYGPRRINVKLAQRLAALGIASVRFDLAGIGDSPRHTGDRPQMEQWVVDTCAAMDGAEQQLGRSRFAMIGLCSGAEVAYRAALVDERISGVVLWDLYAYPTPRSRLMALAYRAGRVTPASLARRARALLGARAGGPGSPDERSLQEMEPQKVPPIEEFAQGLQTLLARKCDVAMMFCGTQPAWYTYPAQFRDAFARFGEVARIECQMLHDVDHMLTLRPSQDQFIRWVEEWFRRMPRSAEALAA